MSEHARKLLRFHDFNTSKPRLRLYKIESLYWSDFLDQTVKKPDWLKDMSLIYVNLENFTEARTGVSTL